MNGVVTKRFCILLRLRFASFKRKHYALCTMHYALSEKQSTHARFTVTRSAEKWMPNRQQLTANSQKRSRAWHSNPFTVYRLQFLTYHDEPSPSHTIHSSRSTIVTTMKHSKPSTSPAAKSQKRSRAWQNIQASFKPFQAFSSPFKPFQAFQALSRPKISLCSQSNKKHLYLGIKNLNNTRKFILGRGVILKIFPTWNPALFIKSDCLPLFSFSDNLFSHFRQFLKHMTEWVFFVNSIYCGFRFICRLQSTIFSCTISHVSFPNPDKPFGFAYPFYDSSRLHCRYFRNFGLASSAPFL